MNRDLCGQLKEHDVRRHLTFAFTLAIAILMVSSPRAFFNEELTIDGDVFEVNDTPRFLVFASYFDGLSASNGDIETDFAYLKSKGIDGVRVMPDWLDYSEEREPGAGAPTIYYGTNTLIETDGSLDETVLEKLFDLLDIARDEGLLVDLSFDPGFVVDCGSPPCNISSPLSSALTYAEFRDALVELADLFAAGGSAYKHVMIDVCNEAELNGSSDKNPFSDYAQDVDDLIEAIHVANGDVIAFASGGFASAEAYATWAAEAEIQVAAWHETRDEAWWEDTYTRFNALVTSYTDLPAYGQEPAPYHAECWFNKEGLWTAVTEAKRAKAAAWTFHTRASFFLNEESLEEILGHGNRTDVEEAFLDGLSSALSCGVGWGSGSACNFSVPGCAPAPQQSPSVSAAVTALEWFFLPRADKTRQGLPTRGVPICSRG